MTGVLDIFNPDNPITKSLSDEINRSCSCTLTDTQVSVERILKAQNNLGVIKFSPIFDKQLGLMFFVFSGRHTIITTLLTKYHFHEAGKPDYNKWDDSFVDAERGWYITSKRRKEVQIGRNYELTLQHKRLFHKLGFQVERR